MGWLVLSIVVWLLAALFYVVVVGLIATRVVARLVAPGDVTPDSWILMGTVATLTLAVAHGDTTLKNQDAFIGLTGAMDPIIATLWIFATLWIPVLLAAEFWHFDRSDNALGRARTWWSAVFPLAMYSAATQATASQLHLPPLHVCRADLLLGGTGHVRDRLAGLAARAGPAQPHTGVTPPRRVSVETFGGAPLPRPLLTLRAKSSSEEIRVAKDAGWEESSVGVASGRCHHQGRRPPRPRAVGSPT